MKMVDNKSGDEMKNKIVIREFKEATDFEAVEKLEKNCEIGYKKGISIFMTGDDPLCRIRLYPLHVMLVAQLLESGELVGAVRGCIKRVGTRFGGTDVSMGCILGLRVSPSHRRMGIGLGLVKSVEEWMERNGAEYAFLATEENNTASTNLFSVKCNYVKFSSLVIYVQPVVRDDVDGDHLLAEELGVSGDIKIDKLHIDQAVAIYRDCLRKREIYPTDIDAILRESLSMGTWVCFFRDEKWAGLDEKQEPQMDSIMGTAPSSWAIFSIWNTSSETYKRRPNLLRVFHASFSHAMETILPCLKLRLKLKLPFMSRGDAAHSSNNNNHHHHHNHNNNQQLHMKREKPLGFLFLYGIHGEGERVGELMKGMWRFAARMGEKVKDCSVMMTELGGTDPLRPHLHRLAASSSSISCINDLWYLKRLNGGPLVTDHGDDDGGNGNELTVMRPVGNVFVDPREF